MSYVISPSELKNRIEVAEKAYDPQTHGRFDLSAPPLYPLDEWYHSEDFPKSVHEVIAKGENYYYDRIFYARVVEKILDVLTLEEVQTFAPVITLINGKDIDNNRVNDYWSPEEVKSLYLLSLIHI